MKNTCRASLNPLEVEREIRNDLYLVVLGVHIEELELPAAVGCLGDRLK
jgi:hypothetical protein